MVMKKPCNKNTLLILVSIVLLMGYIYWYQKNNEPHLTVKATESLNYLPSGTFLRGMALGYDQAFADFLWVQTVGYFGAHAKTDQDYTWLTHMLQLIAELDPLYESPYEFAGVVLPSELKNVDEGMAFLEAGIDNIPKHNPRYWLQPFYLGFCYMIYKDDPLKAAEYLEMAAKYPQSPGYLPLLVSRLYARADKPGVGIDIIIGVLNTKTSDTKKKLSFDSALLQRLKELVAGQNIKMLQESIDAYIALYGQKPSTLSDIVDGLILPFIPEEPFGGTYFLSIEGTQVLSTHFDGEFRIYGVDNK